MSRGGKSLWGVELQAPLWWRSVAGETVVWVVYLIASRDGVFIGVTELTGWVGLRWIRGGP